MLISREIGIVITRRQIVSATAWGVATFAARSVAAPAGAPGDVRVGAIRWDAWYGGTTGSNSWYASHNLDPSQYHRRAPFFAKQLAPDQMAIFGDQAAIDAEIAYAVEAGLKYWAFDWYPADRPFRTAWNLFQKSSLKNDINWCLLAGFGGFAGGQPSTEELVGYFGQSNYERVGRRPLLYLLSEEAPLPAVARAVLALRKDAKTAGVDNPYIVVCNGNPETAASELKAIEADAISAYAHAVGGPAAYSVLDASTREFWGRMAAARSPIVPVGMSGWDRRPRIEHPVPWEANTQKPYVGMGNFVTSATPAELEAHMRALVAYVADNPGECPASHALIYAWDEFDEGGWICPTWTANGPDTSRVVALSKALRQQERSR